MITVQPSLVLHSAVLSSRVFWHGTTFLHTYLCGLDKEYFHSCTFDPSNDTFPYDTILPLLFTNKQQRCASAGSWYKIGLSQQEVLKTFPGLSST